MKKLLILLIFIFSAIQINAAQNIKTLKSLLEVSKGNPKVEVLNQMSIYYLQRNSNLSMEYANKAFDLAQKLKYDKGLAYALLNLGKNHYRKKEYETALHYSLNSLYTFNEINHELGRSEASYYVGISYSYLNDIAKGEMHLRKALEIHDSTNTTHFKAEIYSGIAKIEEEKGNLKEAKENLSESIKLFLAKGNKELASENLMLLGSLYYKEDKLEEALINYKKAERLKTELGNLTKANNLRSLIKNIEKDLGNTDFNTDSLLNEEFGRMEEIISDSIFYLLKPLEFKTPEKEIEYYEKEIERHKNTGHLYKLDTAYFKLGQKYESNRNFSQALDYYKKSLHLKEKLNDKKGMITSFDYIARMYKLTGNFNEALMYKELYTALKDSLDNMRIKNKISNLQLQIEQEKNNLLSKNQELLRNKSDLDKKQKLYLVLIIAILAVAITIILLAFYQNRKNTQLLEKKNQELNEVSQKFSTIFRSSPVAIDLSTYPEGEYIEANQSFFDLFQLKPEEVIGKKFADFPIWDDVMGRQQLIAILKKNKRIHNLEVIMKKKNGENIFALVSGEVIEISGKPHILGSILNISEIKKAEIQLIKAKDAANSANRMKSEFLANMSHEIRTPMNAVLGFSELLRNRIIDSKNKEYIEAIIASGKNLLTLINDILDLSKIEAGKMELRPNLLNLKDVIEEVNQIFSYKFMEKNLEFRVNISEETPQVLNMDEARFRQILVNLVGNAVKFTESGYIEVRVTIDRLYEKLRTCDMEICISDTGIGIPKDQQEIIFEAFRQRAGQSHKAYGGTGLGLAITKRLIEIMNGSISVNSTPNKGSEFTIKIPSIEYDIELLKATNLNVNGDVEDIFFHNSNILIVDDHNFNLKLIKEILKVNEIKMFTAHNGYEALDIIEKEKIDLVLMDLKMPELDGYQATKIIKRNNYSKDIPVIALTASVIKNDESKISEAGFNGFLLKPIEKEILYKELMKHLPYTVVEEEEEIEVKNEEEVQIKSDESFSKDVISILETDYLREWEEIKNSSRVGLIQKFANDLIDYSKEKNIGLLYKYAYDLNKVSGEFEIDTMKELLEEFPNIIEKIKNS